MVLCVVCPMVFSVLGMQCSSDCGPGIQSRHVFCGSFSESEGAVSKVDESLCDASMKFEDQQPCVGEGECKGEWFTGAYGQVC